LDKISQEAEQKLNNYYMATTFAICASLAAFIFSAAACAAMPEMYLF